MRKMVGKRFDGASTMSGASTRLYRATILAHCRNRALNFVIVASYSCTPDIRKFMELRFSFNVLLNKSIFCMSILKMIKSLS